MRVAYCPNCGKRYYYADLINDVTINPGHSGCGDCAQACVRPRELYRLRITDTEWDSGEKPDLEHSLARLAARSDELVIRFVNDPQDDWTLSGSRNSRIYHANTSDFDLFVANVREQAGEM